MALLPGPAAPGSPGSPARRRGAIGIRAVHPWPASSRSAPAPLTSGPRSAGQIVLTAQRRPGQLDRHRVVAGSTTTSQSSGQLSAGQSVTVVVEVWRQDGAGGNATISIDSSSPAVEVSWDATTSTPPPGRHRPRRRTAGLARSRGLLGRPAEASPEPCEAGHGAGRRRVKCSGSANHGTLTIVTEVPGAIEPREAYPLLRRHRGQAVARAGLFAGWLIVAVLGLAALLRLVAWDSIEPLIILNALTLIVYLPCLGRSRGGAHSAALVACRGSCPHRRRPASICHAGATRCGSRAHVDPARPGGAGIRREH